MRVMHERSGSLSRSRPRAIVVDPDPADRASAAHWLTELGYEVRQAEDFEHARPLLEPPPAAIVTTLRLGAYNGFHLIIVAQSAGHRVAAAVVTKHDDSVARGEAARLGIGYLVKPLTRESLAETIGDGLIGRACTR
jgi:DNA-binding response OmpR family regulator